MSIHHQMKHNLDTNIDYFERHINTIRRKYALVCIFLIVLATIPVALGRATSGWDNASTIQFTCTIILLLMFTRVYNKGYEKAAGMVIFFVDMILMSVVILDPLGSPLIVLFFITPLLVAYLFFQARVALLLSTLAYSILSFLYFLQYIDTNSSEFPFEMVLLVFSGISCVAGLHVVIGLRYDIEKRLMSVAHTDALTHLPNRMYFNDRLTQELSRTDREHMNLCLGLIDLDLFKRINDTYGHECGDKVLVQVANIINQSIREQDIACRVGGEEIAIIMPNVTAAEAINILERLRQEIQQTTIRWHKHTINLTISVGIAEYSPNQDKLQLYSEADSAMYKAKKNGRNQVACYEP